MAILIIIIVVTILIICYKSANGYSKKLSCSTESSQNNTLILGEDKAEQSYTPSIHVLTEDEISFLNGDGGLINVAIKGLYYRTESDKQEARRLMYGCIVALRKESNNPQDAFAVAVYTQSENHIGYIPKEYSKGITDLIDKGVHIECMITKNTRSDIPYLYMDITYKSVQRLEMEQELELDLVKRLEQIGLKETCKLRWQYVFGEIKPSVSDKTLEISASYQYPGFTIKEKLESKEGKIKEIEYAYNQNIGRNNYEIAERLEKANDIEGAILQYELNLNIEECVADSAYRLSVLYKKTNRHKDIIPMLQAALEKAKKLKDGVDIHKITERSNTFLENNNFIKKYGSEI